MRSDYKINLLIALIQFCVDNCLVLSVKLHDTEALEFLELWRKDCVIEHKEDSIVQTQIFMTVPMRHVI